MSRNALVEPFKALRPTAGLAEQVIAPPYDVIDLREARSLADGKPYSFLRISRAELELSDTINPHSEEVYQRAADNLCKLQTKNVLRQDASPSYYVYRISNNKHTQTGIAVSASINAYKNNKIKRHELTRTTKENDRIRQIEATKAQTGPVMLVNRHCPSLTALLKQVSEQTRASNKGSIDEWTHEIWPITDAALVNNCSRIINGMGALYIADGHHRSAAAEKVFDKHEAENNSVASGFLAVIFDEKELKILDYNRVIRDLNNLTPEEFLLHLDKNFSIEKKSTAYYPSERFQYGLFLDGVWYKLRLVDNPPSDQPIDNLDVSILENFILKPILNIKDSRTDDRIDFVGGSRRAKGVTDRIESGDMVAGFMLPPTTIAELMLIADENKIMPPKSTWFEPKLADGLLSLPI